MRWMLLPGLLVVVVALLSVALAPDEADAVKKTDLPESVLQAFVKAYPEVKVTGYDIETVAGVIQYEIETETDEVEIDYVYIADGTLLQIEEEIPVDALPEPVTKAVNKAHEKCEIEKAERITRGDVVEYEVVIVVDDKEFELMVASDGTILDSDQTDEDASEDDENADDSESDVDDDEDAD